MLWLQPRLDTISEQLLMKRMPIAMRCASTAIPTDRTPKRRQEPRLKQQLWPLSLKLRRRNTTINTLIWVIRTSSSSTTTKARFTLPKTEKCCSLRRITKVSNKWLLRLCSSTSRQTHISKASSRRLALRQARVNIEACCTWKHRKWGMQQAPSVLLSRVHLARAVLAAAPKMPSEMLWS